MTTVTSTITSLKDAIESRDADGSHRLVRRQRGPDHP